MCAPSFDKFLSFLQKPMEENNPKNERHMQDQSALKSTQNQPKTVPWERPEASRNGFPARFWPPSRRPKKRLIFSTLFFRYLGDLGPPRDPLGGPKIWFRECFSLIFASWGPFGGPLAARTRF